MNAGIYHSFNPVCTVHDVALGTDWGEVRLASRGDAVFLAYQHAAQQSATSTVVVEKLASDSWTAYPALSIAGAYLQLAVAPDGAPVVAWQDGQVLRARRWSEADSTWKALVDIAPPAGWGFRYLGGVRVDDAGVVHVAFFQATETGNLIRVMRWSESSADAIGDPASTTAAAWWPSLALDSAGRPVVAYTETGGGFGVSRWDGAAWSAVLHVAQGSNTFSWTDPRLAVDPVEGLFVGASSGRSVSMWRDAGASWTNLDAPVSLGIQGSLTFHAFADGAGLGRG